MFFLVQIQSYIRSFDHPSYLASIWISVWTWLSHPLQAIIMSCPNLNLICTSSSEWSHCILKAEFLPNLRGFLLLILPVNHPLLIIFIISRNLHNVQFSSSPLFQCTCFWIEFTIGVPVFSLSTYHHQYLSSSL